MTKLNPAGNRELEMSEIKATEKFYDYGRLHFRLVV